jgi:hypothetical protein
MAKHMIDESEKRRAACEACYLLNWAIGDLIASARLFEFTYKWEQLTPQPLQAIRVSRRMILMSLVVIVYRLKEAREQLIVEWLLSEAELQNLGFRAIDEVMGGEKKWRYFETIRGQYAGHSFAKRATNTRPGRIVDPRVLGKALREIGLFEPAEFLKRARGLVPGVEKVRDELSRRYPEARQFLKDYGSDLEQGAT